MNSTIFSNAASVLVIKLRAIGDVLLATPVLENLKVHFPHLDMDFLCEKFAADVLAGNPFVRTVVTFNKKKDSSLSLISTIRNNHYDIVIDLFGNPRTALITRFSGAKYRIGFPFRGRAYAYNVRVKPRGGEVHNVDFNLDVLRHFGISPVESGPLFLLNEEEKNFAEVWLQKEHLIDSEIICINPSGGWYTKKWNLESYAQLADRIIEERGSNIVFFWGPGEENDVKQIQSTMKHSSSAIPKTSLKEMGALLGRCNYLISNDSGPMHIAASLRVPTLGIFGPTNPYLQGPYGSKNMWIRDEELDCLACNLTQCPIGNICMKGLSVEKVFEAFKKLVEKNSK